MIFPSAHKPVHPSHPLPHLQGDAYEPQGPSVSCCLPSLETKRSWSLISRSQDAFCKLPPHHMKNIHYCAHKPLQLVPLQSTSRFLCLVMPSGTLAPARRIKAGAQASEADSLQGERRPELLGTLKSRQGRKGHGEPDTHPLTGTDP